MPPDDSGPATAARLEAALARLARLHPKIIDLSLDRLDGLLARLGRPERALAPVVHVAGTNGKGSTLAFIRAGLEAAGRRVHVYTSPHLVRFNERIVVAGETIADRPLADLLDRVERINQDRPITYFEVTTAAALLAFAETPADNVLLEVGMGGRLDATNVVDRPAVTAITRVSMDHMQFLGPTLAAIAAEKAGIAKPGVPLVVGPQAPEADAVIAAHAAAVGAPLSAAGDGPGGWRIEPEDGGFVRVDAHGRRRFADPPLPGRHQRDNLGVAVGCLDVVLGRPVTPAEIAAAAARVRWPGRLQRLDRGPLVDRLPSGWRLWLDGGHNDSAGAALADWAAGRPGSDARPLVVLAGMLESKAPADFLRPLAPHVAALAAIAIPGEPASLPAEALADLAQDAGIAAVAPHATPDAAVDWLAAQAGGADLLITGSLYLAGRILADHG